MMSRQDPRTLLLNGAHCLGLDLTEGQVEEFLVYLEALKSWNQRINLTSLTSSTDIIERHFLDSLMGTQCFRPSAGLKVMDIGTGAGFPGFPIKLYYPTILLTLVEPAHKKAAFLHKLNGSLRLEGVTIRTETVERLKEDTESRKAYDILVLRAFTKPRASLEAATPFLAPEGQILLYVSSGEGKRWRSEAGWEVRHLLYTLPFSGLDRAIVRLTRS